MNDSNNGDRGMSPAQSLIFGAMIAGAIVGLFYFIRWVWTTREGAITGFVLAVVILFMYLLGAFSEPTTSTNHGIHQQPRVIASAPNGSRIENPPARGQDIDQQFRTVVNGNQVCTTYNGQTSCVPLR